MELNPRQRGFGRNLRVAPGEAIEADGPEEACVPQFRRRSPRAGQNGSCLLRRAIMGSMTRRTLIGGAVLLLPQPAPGTGSHEAFRRWFCWLAESLYFMRQLPEEVKDCSSLLRFAYREALRRHDGRWARRWGYEQLPPIPDPHLKAPPLFETGGRMRHFADARHLMRFNTRRISSRIRDAFPADLLFFRSAEGGSWHAMVYIGRSQFESSPENFVVYHTGPEGGWPGEVRRPSLGQLLAHPEPRWRPAEGNPHFLGVFRWKVLLEEG